MTEPELGLRERNRLEKQKKISAAALALFSSKGVEATTLSEVARKAGVAKGTVFLYAPDKTDLIHLVMHDVLESTVDQAFATLPKRVTLVPKLLHVFGELFRMYERNGSLGREFVRSLPGATGPNAQRVNALTFGFMHRVGGLILEAQGAGEVRADVPPLLVAQNVFALYFMGVMGWLGGMVSIEEALDPMLSSALGLLMTGIGKR